MAEFGRIEVRGSEEWESEELGILNVCTVTQSGEERVGEQKVGFSQLSRQHEAKGMEK